ncbi:hypothetical protein CS063_14335 [Sporanaerobium hydrogeniformans]|uniref:Uncharacterized protein n=1 Tax=Sporanaerobium hydrogeniformans TaxID=3072179 RepID=A0AC61D9I9_9FIRM|nr:HAMP domain-containing sensor histidine kinase [Sporanaerobium hydrogeniformans]PHV69672.1 hypothetical protein CS063_14335 [Sporanaerobium hydrogeniformans]
MSRERKKLFHGKITLKLSLLISTMFVILLGIIIAAQFLYFNRVYLTTEYTKQKEKKLSDQGRDFFIDHGIDLVNSNQNNMLDALNKYSSKNSVYSMLVGNDGEVICRGSTIDELKPGYIEDIQKQIRGLVFEDDISKSFRINTRYGLPTRYIAVVYGREFYPLKPIYLVSIIKEVYTSENYLLLTKFSLYLLLLVLVLGVIAAYVFSYYITKPVLEIMDSASRIAKLDFSKKCEYKKSDELGVLAQNLNDMSDILDTTITQLEKANERLEEDINLQKAFVADVSHEFKTPLTIIRGFIEILLDKKVDKAVQEDMLNTITNEVDRMDKLVYDLLKLSKLESQGALMCKKSIDCTEMLENVASGYKVLMQNKGIVFLQEYDSQIGNMMADQYSIEQVIRNFISNAMTHTQPQKKVILSAKHHNGYVRIAVFNEGQPIEAVELDKIWNKFYRIDKARSRETGGTGLGLSICKRILELHGYHYGVMNVDNGVVFYFDAEII